MGPSVDVLYLPYVRSEAVESESCRVSEMCARARVSGVWRKMAAVLGS
jgi:hypothetical protein